MTRIVALLLLLASSAHADPRWWWDDMRLTATPADSVMPHVTIPGYAFGGGTVGGRAAFVAWSERDPVDGDLEIWMRATFDGGCTWCDAIRITDNSVDDTHPRIAVVGLPTGFFSFAIAYESAGEVVLAWDSTTSRHTVPDDELCSEIQPVGPAIIANDQYLHFGTGRAAEHPRLCQASTPAFGHFHLAWKQSAGLGSGSEIRYAHDLTGEGGAGWLMDAPLLLPPPDPFDDVTEPAI